MKSTAPSRIAATASSMLAQAVIAITGSPGHCAAICAINARPSAPEVVSRA
ncbi:hypothetical protein NB689_003549 [Xanthomonas sacchari]|nr:hypothetical protein [Xanthomonas sacchari]